MKRYFLTAKEVVLHEALDLALAGSVGIAEATGDLWLALESEALFGAAGDEVLEYATASLLKKMLHQPSVRLREAGERSDQKLVDAARRLFGLTKNKE